MLSVLIITGALGAAATGAVGEAAAGGTANAPTLDAPVTHVTVFSDRARVTRTAKVSVSGTQAVALPVLRETVDPATLRVEATGAEVARVDLRRVSAEQMPEDEARLLDTLLRLDGELQRLYAQRDAHRQQARQLAALTPTPESAESLRPPPKLEPSGWMATVRFVTDAQAKLQARARELEAQIEAVTRQRTEVADKALLVGGAERRGGWAVTAHLEGSGAATVRVTYFAGPARWLPHYDLQLEPDTGQLRVGFAGLVSQQTGEDWEDAQLTLSTALPATALQMPEWTGWRIGERERFVPTPSPKAVFVRPPPKAEPAPAVGEDGADRLRQRLVAQARTGPLQLELTNVGGAAARVQQPPPPPARPPSRGSLASRSDRGGGDDDEAFEADVAQPQSTRRSKRSAPAPAPMAESLAGSAYRQTSSGSDDAPSSPFSLSPPPAFRPPAFSPELPISQAGGYDLSFPALQRESVASGGGARRVALFSQRWPVQVERHVFAAVAKEAYLVTELESPSKTPLPGGTAQLYVGADPAGTAQLELVSPGEKVTLPLGLDRALKPVRNVEVLTQEKGLISKDDLTRYVVRIELANPYSTSIAVKVFDQWPLTEETDLEVKLTQTKPYALQDPVTGKLEWHLTLQPRSKTELSFTYSIRKPRGWRLGQQER